MEIKILCSIPCLFGPIHTKEAIDSVYGKESVDVLLIDNGAEESIKNLFPNYPSTHIISNPQNVFVNPAWQQIIDYFLQHEEYSHLIIMNSDLVMQKNWSEVVINRLEENPDEICIPKIIEDKFFMTRDNMGIFRTLDIDTKPSECQIVTEGTPGVFIVMNRKQVNIISPLPTECKIWFGDQFIYTILRSLGYTTVIPDNLLSYHYWSQNVQKVQGISEMIEEDKVNWTNVAEPKMKKIIKEFGKLQKD